MKAALARLPALATAALVLGGAGGWLGDYLDGNYSGKP